jgi:hypothetical protein
MKLERAIEMLEQVLGRRSFLPELGARARLLYEAAQAELRIPSTTAGRRRQLMAALQRLRDAEVAK